MSNIKLFVSTEPWDPVSAIIRYHTTSTWSHAGFIRLSDGWTFSAMLWGGVKWRKPSRFAKFLVLDCPYVDEAFEKALTQEGRSYDWLNILGFVASKNWQRPGKFICDRLVFWAFEQISQPLVNPTFIPCSHFTPRDILLSRMVWEHK